MNKETLACDPSRWNHQTPPDQIKEDLAFYGLEHGHSPEHQKEKGVFVIGYYYQVNSQQKTIYSLNPENGSTYPQDVRQMFDTSTLRGQQEKIGFEKLTQLFFVAPAGSLAIWISPAGDTYSYPRIYMGQVGSTDENGNKTIEAIDFNCDLKDQQLKSLLEKLDPQIYLTPTPDDNDFLQSPLLLTPGEEKPIHHPKEILTAIKELGISHIHGVPIEKIVPQIEEKTWQIYLEKSKEITQRIAFKIKTALDAQNHYQALFYMAQFEQEIAHQGGFFALQSSCGAAISSIFSLSPRPQYGLPAFGLEITGNIQTCPACGHTFNHSIPIGGHCPYCGAERKC
ncbi:hypothetical protein COT63_01595 [Candidatus Shapirobacteria bacterium CG09_land_8_20_14_0_10_38_17]|uniref:Uncharacterized protein n=1 Tax=Candidatus Shapirobacteria bacterium CG09_land_8_20_14_0_10_38_17 TaxID=1974884 RepID=A0A2H0WR29_9BACT|nr:MAG: hypothetical protein COT63_01595 [Candidatus Shapirobacteria bacterium CG09_land_8_20_14_0_10_38_17]